MFWVVEFRLRMTRLMARIITNGVALRIVSVDWISQANVLYRILVSSETDVWLERAY